MRKARDLDHLSIASTTVEKRNEDEIRPCWCHAR
jgi:hypothetical protein